VVYSRNIGLQYAISNGQDLVVVFWRYNQVLVRAVVPYIPVRVLFEYNSRGLTPFAKTEDLKS